MPDYVEARADTWNGAADEIIRKLDCAGVRKGQIISIDAHNNGPLREAIFSAYYDKKRKDVGSLELRYDVQNATYGWDEFYRRAAERCSRIPQQDLISITGSCNSSGHSVFYIFHYHYDVDASGRDIKYLEVRNVSWSSAAKDIIGQLSSRGVQAGQVISVDTHSNGPGLRALISAFWDTSLPALGPLQMDYREMNSRHCWDDHYSFAIQEIGSDWAPALITSSVNTLFKSVTFVFFGAGIQDRIIYVYFDLECAKVLSTTPKLVAKERVDNCSGTKQEIIVEFDEDISGTSEFKYTEGTTISDGFGFWCGLPCAAAGGEVSREVSESHYHTWGKSTTISNQYKVKIPVSAEPHSHVLCCARANESELEVPYTICWSSGRETRGSWRGLQTWGVHVCYEDDDV